MKILSHNKKENLLTVKIVSNEDMWLLEMLLHDAEYVSGWTTRTYKVGNKEEKKRVFVTLHVESIKYDEHTEHLRILGTIVDGKPEEFIQKGRHQTLEVGIDSKISITKDWKRYELERIRDTEKYSHTSKILVVVLDNEKAIFAILSGERTKYVQVIRSGLHKDDENYESNQRSYFGKIVSEIMKFDGPIVIAGPGFTKDNIKNFIKQKHPNRMKDILFDSCSYAEPNGVHELIKRGVINRISTNFHLSKEREFIESFMQMLSKNPNMVAYGPDGIIKAYDYGAIKKLLVAYKLLRSNKDVGDVVNGLIKSKKDVIIVMDKSENYEQVSGFDGAMAMLSFTVD